MTYHVTFDPKHLSTSEWCQSVTYGQCVTRFESRHVTSDPTYDSRTIASRTSSVCLVTCGPRLLSPRRASVFNRFLREVHIHSGSPHLVQCLSAYNGTGCALMCCMCASMCTCTYTSAVVTSDMDCCSLDVTQITRTLGRQILFTIWTNIFFNLDKYIL